MIFKSKLTSLFCSLFFQNRQNPFDIHHASTLYPQYYLWQSTEAVKSAAVNINRIQLFNFRRVNTLVHFLFWSFRFVYADARYWGLDLEFS